MPERDAPPEIDTLILIDRDVDKVTPVCIQFKCTYAYTLHRHTHLFMRMHIHTHLPTHTRVRCH